MNIWFWVQTWVDVDFLAVGKLTKTTFPMAYEAKKGRLTFSFYVIKRFTQIFVKVNQKWKMKEHDINYEEDSEKNPRPRWDLNPRPSVI